MLIILNALSDLGLGIRNHGYGLEFKHIDYFAVNFMYFGWLPWNFRIVEKFNLFIYIFVYLFSSY
jgi:hypothetical protein